MSVKIPNHIPQSPSIATGGLTAKELSCLTGLMRNEELLIRFSVQGAVQCRSEPLRTLMADLARGRMDGHNGLLQMLSVRAKDM